MTEATLNLSLKRGQELGIEDFVVASSTGYTAKLMVEKGVKPVCVRYHAGFREPGDQVMEEKTKAELESKGVTVLTTTHLMGGIDRGLENKFGGCYPAGVVAHTLRMFGHGTKVALEIAVMALDAGLIPFGREIVSIGGSGRGADTALVLVPSHAKSFFEGEIKEIICKPREF
ncbi:MAG: hypothetical protein D5R97_00390 [Candidatus Syntrophonatronum acetioxidans]|uniref:Pyruvate kinase C-terminal domain-containing protein n=1 Tax=Candidatus Syntrophonatronum acetioxidans TaxID=1795816 RepID=A0A424YIY6_9FIRM|nr:MAG: hypothetical protein D5R97_00390 [Candidatus Syntrophonatronum acetioxidans]